MEATSKHADGIEVPATPAARQLLKIEVVYHVIIGRATPERQKDYSSLRELGYFYA